MKTKDEKYFTPGTIILVHGNSWLSKSIQFFMKIYAKEQHRSDKVFFNHSAICIDIWGDIFVCEADRIKSKGVQAGVIIRRLEDTPYFKDKNFILMHPEIPFEKEEQEKISNACINFSFKNTRYDYYGTFVRQIKKSITGKWNNKEVETDRVYCSELVATVTNEARKLFDNPAATNPQDVYWNTNYKIIDLYGLIY